MERVTHLLSALTDLDMEAYDKIKKSLAVAFMHDLDNNRPEGKMCLSNGECADIEKAFNEQDWPKLARYLDKYTESEDERIRKSLIELVEQFMADERKEKTLAYLEKQKDAFENGRQLGIMQEQAKQELEWTDEKQKEQNCEDEKCTDFTIYHPLKNGKGKYECIPYSFYGSLTSFSEDKDLIDFLRTCFYTEEECEAWIEKQKEPEKEELVYRLNGLMQEYINEGEDEDEKEHRLKCYKLFWDSLEDTSYFEQQEQKPNIELLQRSWYMEGYRDGNFGNEPKWIVKTGKGGPRYEENPKYGQLLKEPKPAEWSEEDSTILDCAVEVVEKAGLPSLAASLKSLRPSWKPSEEQMKALAMVIDSDKPYCLPSLESLYNDLMKL